MRPRHSWAWPWKAYLVLIVLYDLVRSPLCLCCLSLLSVSTLTFLVAHHPALHSGRQVYGSDLRSVLRQPLIIPIFMPRLPLDISNLQIEPTYTSPFSAPAILMAMQSRLRTSLVGVSELGYDLHFWYINGAARWEGADRFWDGTADLMWSLHKWFKTTSQTCQATTTNLLFNLADSYGALEVARRYRRRFILPDVPLHHPTSTARLFVGLPTLRESLLFRAWVKRSPPDSMRSLEAPQP